MTPVKPKHPYDKYKFFTKADPLCIYNAVKTLSSWDANYSISDDDEFVACKIFIQHNDNGACKKFNKLISLLCKTNSCLENDKSLKGDVYKYLNFWLNQELNPNTEGVSALLEKYNESVKNVNGVCFKKKKLADNLRYIDESNLKGMNLLNKIYTYYYEIISKDTSHENRLCSENSQNLANKYNIARNMCIDSNYGLYSALMDFKNTYEKLYEKVPNTGKCNSADLIKLPSEYDILRISLNGIHNIKRKTMISATLLGPIIVFFLLLIYFFMFTPLGTYICVKERKKKKSFGNRDDNIQESLSDAYHNDTRNANRRRLNISYNAS
ncbi:Plasmodium vivax Vir protein, putative [Plasmodium vivax]|nr:Plasmodium vivax Vir protein, putative [Plasmodium vivax]